MNLPQKALYAVRAVFELAKDEHGRPLKAAHIAEAEAIPPGFLHAILNQLRQAGIVESVRGKAGGYRLAVDAGHLTMGQVIEVVLGPLVPVDCLSRERESECPLREDCVFMPVWEEAYRAMKGVYDSVTFKELVERDAVFSTVRAPDYSI